MGKFLIAGVLGLLLVGSVSAHQLKTAISTVLFNERTGNIEVMHRFYLHDAEHAIKQLVDKNADLHSNKETRQQFADYVLAHFAMNDLSKNELALETVGFQVDGAHFWVYQETPIPADIAGLTMQFNALQEVWPDQQNMVNVERRVAGDKVIQSVNFTSQDDWQSVQF